MQSPHKVSRGVKLHCTDRVHASTLTGTFTPIAGILELVNRTLVNGVSLLTRRRKRGRWKGKTEEKEMKRFRKKQRKGQTEMCEDSTGQKRSESNLLQLLCCSSKLFLISCNMWFVTHLYSYFPSIWFQLCWWKNRKYWSRHTRYKKDWLTKNQN